MRTLILAAGLCGIVASSPGSAQTAGPIDLRVGKLEKEMKAVQRKIFPNGLAIEPDIGVPSANTSGTSASAPLADLNARVDALETQLKSLTGQSEQDGFRIRKLEDAVKALRGETDARLKALEPAATPEPLALVPDKPASAIVPAAAKLSPPTTKASGLKPAQTIKLDPARKARIAAIEIPQSGNPTEDAYTYGFRLWTDKLYPEAQVKLKEFVATYPKHKRTSYAQNLLGRAYFDEGKPALASVAFFDNYQKNPRGERAPESLYWLGVSLTKLKKTADACKVYTEFSEVYGPTATSDLKAKVAKGRTDAKCAS